VPTPKAPALLVIAGPNGAGKTTLYRSRIAPRFPHAEFVNADELALQQFGHVAVTREETETGQKLAEERRRFLMAARRDLVMESTFSHPSKLDLVRQAKTQGYLVLLCHVHVQSPELSVLRVGARVKEGGHPVPADKIRRRFLRNQALIHEAAMIADRTYVFDNSALDQPHRLLIELHRGQVLRAAGRLPAWARKLYGRELSNRDGSDE
jgi:predicted ABC-type ATPase